MEKDDYENENTVNISGMNNIQQDNLYNWKATSF